jgi:DDE superfamily endonuclease
MSAEVSVPDSLSSLLQRFRSCFTAPGYEVFTAMFTGFILRPVERTVCGMLTGAGLAGVWHHSRAHRFFANTRWDVRQVGLILACLVVELLLPPDAPILLAIDETLTRRRGPRVFAASWWHDGSAAGAAKVGYGNSWVVLAIVVTLPFCRRPVALPILFSLCLKGGRSKPDLGRDLLDQVAEAFPARTIHLVGDAAYGAGHFAGLGRNMTITTRARSNAVFHHPTPAASGKRGRPRLRGERIGTPADIATKATKDNTWTETLINRYGTTITARTCEITGLWFGVWRTDPIRVILVKDSHRKATTNKSYDIAIVTTDMTTSAAEIVARYASRWSIEVCFHDGKNITGVGETQNRTEKAVHRSVPFTFMAQTITVLWYTTNANPETQIAQRRRNAPWYTTKTDPSTMDMLYTLRDTLTTHRINPPTPGHATPQQKPNHQVSPQRVAS